MKAKDERNESRGVYSLEFMRSQAAMYLLSQGKTDLKSGNSIRAVQRFAQARELNPWHDDIKDFYVLSVNTLIKVTKRLSNEKCEVINDRLGFIYSVAADRMTELLDLTSKCSFRVGASSAAEFHNLPISESGQSIQNKEFESLLEEAENKVKKNQYVPRKELLFLGLSYLNGLQINLGKPMIGAEVDDLKKVRVLSPISTSYNGEMTAEEYCKKTRKLLQDLNYEREIADTDDLRYRPDGYLTCRHYYDIIRPISFYTSPNFRRNSTIFGLFLKI
ncbi:MAG: hypothetical protein IPJ71_15730 [Bdellovibrionales bacterium]|nr:hypothetical protein [Bdellovibrionales bacterium]